MEKVSVEEMCGLLLVHHEALRRLGFSADDIYVAFGILNPNTGEKACGVALRTQGKEWNGGISACAASDSEVAEAWKKYAAEAVQWYGNEKFNLLWTEHMPLERLEEIAMSVALKGIELPAVPGMSVRG